MAFDKYTRKYDFKTGSFNFVNNSSKSFFVNEFKAFISVFNKKIDRKYNIINITNALLLDILMIFIIDIVNKNNIDIYEKVTVFSNSKLLVLLELSTGIFTSWILLNIFISLKEKLKKYDKAEYPDMPEIIFN